MCLSPRKLESLKTRALNLNTQIFCFNLFLHLNSLVISSLIPPPQNNPKINIYFFIKIHLNPSIIIFFKYSPKIIALSNLLSLNFQSRQYKVLNTHHTNNYLKRPSLLFFFNFLLQFQISIFASSKSLFLVTQ
ncbi:unnamed protein product [Meloidogyne enterolobii]|uniref:Uncharacterized protein n=1 Tax=Meloidogyne enterolobii TaxID=390850 RepID=A0ACB0ZJL6_MELEN